MSDWQPMATIPSINWGTGAPEVLLYGTFGVRQGRAARYPDGHIFATLGNVNGNIADETTHWMPLPDPPTEAS